MISESLSESESEYAKQERERERERGIAVSFHAAYTHLMSLCD